MSKISRLHFALGSLIIDIPELELPDKGVTAITGPSGSGKTTFFKILIGLHQPKNWSWMFNGVEMSVLPIPQRQLGVVFQTYELFPHLTAEENIKIVMQSRNNITTASVEQLKHFKAKLKLERCWQTKGKYLSGGEQQRVALLRAILSAPRMILLDEPFSALDQALRYEAYEIVQDVLSEIQVPALMITHNLAEARLFTKHIVEFKNGRLA